MTFLDLLQALNELVVEVSLRLLIQLFVLLQESLLGSYFDLELVWLSNRVDFRLDLISRFGVNFYVLGSGVRRH